MLCIGYGQSPPEIDADNAFGADAELLTLVAGNHKRLHVEDGAHPIVAPPRVRVKHPHEDAQYLRNLPYTISLPTLGALVVHAGLVPGVALEAQDPAGMYTMRWPNGSMTNPEILKHWNPY